MPILTESRNNHGCARPLLTYLPRPRLPKCEPGVRWILLSDEEKEERTLGVFPCLYVANGPQFLALRNNVRQPRG